MNEPARSESLDARAWWTLAVVVAVLLVVYLGLSAGLMPKAHHDDDPTTAGEVNGGSDGATPPKTDFEAGEALDPQSLRDFGELGVLPGLLDDFSNVPDCDFDDALSTCQ